jgi:hypothetical protein
MHVSAPEIERAAGTDTRDAPSNGQSSLGLPRLGFAALVVFVSLVWFRVHSWEAYMYASSHEGFFNLTDLFSSVQGGIPLPDISRYHPYHPLFHAVVTTIWDAVVVIGRPLGATPSALTVAAVVNKVAALAVAVLAYRILSALLQDRWSATVAVGGMVFTKAFLFGAFSGDAHVVSLAFFLGTVALVLPPTSRTDDERPRMLLAAVLFSIGAAFNLAIFFYGLVPLAVLMVARRWTAATIAVVVSGVLLFFVYVAVPVMLFDIDDLAGYERLFGIYSYLAHDPSPLTTRIVEFAHAFSAGLVGGIDQASTVVRVTVGLLLAGGFVAFVAAARTGPGPTPRFWVPLWFFGFALGELSMNTESSVNGTVYVMVPTFAFIGALVRAASLRWRWVPALLVLVVGAFNAVKVVAPKARSDSGFTSALAAIKEPLPSDTPTAVLLSHMSLFQDIYHLGHDRRFASVRAFVPEVNGSRARLQAWIDDRDMFCLLSSNPLPSGLRVLVRSTAQVSPDAYHFSVNHSDSWRPVQRSTHFGCRLRR